MGHVGSREIIRKPSLQPWVGGGRGVIVGEAQAAAVEVMRRNRSLDLCSG